MTDLLPFARKLNGWGAAVTAIRAGTLDQLQREWLPVGPQGLLRSAASHIVSLPSDSPEAPRVPRWGTTSLSRYEPRQNRQCGARLVRGGSAPLAQAVNLPSRIR